MEEYLVQHRDREPFDNIKKGIKKMEIRLFDEKRQKIMLNQIIKLVNRADENETLLVRVVGLSRFVSFEKLFNSSLAQSIKQYEKDILLRVYPKEKEDKYGVLVIHIELI